VNVVCRILKVKAKLGSLLNESEKLTLALASSIDPYHRSTDEIFNVVHATNFGAAFSFLDIPGGAQRWLFSTISLIVSIVLMIWLLRTPATQRWQLTALALIIGGALGNLWDRAVNGYVIDFLQFHLGQYYYPAFNVADSAVCVGAAILIFTSIWNKK
jgi:signal peptidase II